MAKTVVNINQKGSKRNNDFERIYYVYRGDEYLPIFSGTLKMCQDYIGDSVWYSLDHRNIRPEFK